VGRLLTVTKDGSLVEEYRYNANGSRIYEMNAQKGISGRNLSYSDEDHLLTAGDASYQYDADGFLTTRTVGSDVTTYDYSSRGELYSVGFPNSTFIEYVHDPLGRRIGKKVNAAVVEKYLWAGMTKLLAVYDGSGSLKMRFEYADGRTPYAMTQGGAVYYLTFDQVGSLRVVADASGNVVKGISYDTFGNIIADTNPSFEIPFGFAGGLHDRDTGLVRFGFRDYDPETGRWTAKDPIGFAGGDTDLYGYCLNDSLNWVDPLGLEWYRNQGDGYDFGRPGSIVEPGDPISRFAEDNMAHMAETADIHDEIVSNLTDMGVWDILANYPTTVPAYGAACIENNFTEYDEQRDFFILFEVRW
jgi:RHS repeat-associated protein